MTDKLKCYICNKENGDGGIVLLNQYICRNCEKELITTPITELKYYMFKNKIKDIWSMSLKEG